MTRQLENRIAALTETVEELTDHVAELEEFRTWVLDPDADEEYDPDVLYGAGTKLDRTELDASGPATVTTPDADGTEDDPEAGTVEVVDRDGGGWRTVRNTATGEERRVQGAEAEAAAVRELSS